MQKYCLITGGNSGIGLQAALQFVDQGFYVFIGVRSHSKGEKAVAYIQSKTGLNSVEYVLMDMSLQSSIQKAGKTLLQKLDHLDVLIHNAATFDISQKKRAITEEGIEQIWATNHIGPIVLTQTLDDLLKKSKKAHIITIASKGLVVYPKLKLDFKDPEFEKTTFKVTTAYYQSKLAQIMYTYWLADRFKAENINVNCIRVPAVKTDLSRYSNLSSLKKFVYKLKSRFSLSPEEMAKSYVALAIDPKFEKYSACYLDENLKKVTSSEYSRNKLEIKKVMDLSFRYLKSKLE